MSGAEINKALSENGSPEKKHDKSSIIDLKNGKVVCKQKPISFEKQSETLQEIVKFREMVEERIEKEESALTAIPEEHRPLIAKLAHESDKGLGPLAKHIRQELLPVQDDDDADKSAKANAVLPLAVVELAITSILDRNNYGLDTPIGLKPSASLCVWRWEVKAQHKDWLPKNGQEKAESRLEERKLAKKALNATFEALPQTERDAIFAPKGATNKLPPKALNTTETSTPEPSEKAESVVVESAKKQGKRKVSDNENELSESASKPSKPKKVVDPEKVAKEKERLEKRAAKAERERKEKDAQSKSRSIMSNFFSKAKASIPNRSPANDATPSTASSSKIQSDFDKTFKPFVLKKDSVLAPINVFKTSKHRNRKSAPISTTAEVIVIDDQDNEVIEDVEMHEAQVPDIPLTDMSPQDRLKNILSSLPPSIDPMRLGPRKLPPGYKTYHPTSVRDTISQLSEAEVAGDDSLVRTLLMKLQDRNYFPANAYIFHEDARPGYFGTWTRSSRIIGPRRPLARDVLAFDYGYDSGEEWEEEPVGDDVADDDDEEETVEDVDSDADSWLVEDDEEPEIDVNLHDIDSLNPPDIFDLPPPLPKRKADDGERKMSKKRKVVVPLVPFAKGPCWEETIGQCSYDLFKPYRIQLFNDTPYPIDPFTYVSTCIEDFRDSRTAKPSVLPPTTTTNDGFAVPSLPARVAGTHGPALPSGSHPSSSATPTQQPPVLQPRKNLKTPFPDVHLPQLINKILQLETGSFNLLVEVIYEDLKPNKVTKAAVEAKIREVGEKCKKRWTVKPAYLALVQTQAQVP